MITYQNIQKYNFQPLSQMSAIQNLFSKSQHVMLLLVILQHCLHNSRVSNDGSNVKKELCFAHLIACLVSRVNRSSHALVILR